MKNIKGFTLIELLAVLTILAIIATITIPIVSKIVSKSKNDTAEISAKAYENAVNQALMEKEFDGNRIPNGYYDVLPDGNVCIEKDTYNNNICNYVLNVDVKNTHPNRGYIVVDSSDIIWYELDINNKTILKGEYTPLKYFNFDSSTGTITPASTTAIDSEISDLIIPNEINEVPIRIVDGFSDLTLNKVILPRSLEVIEEAAFSQNHIRNIVIPNNVTTIGKNSFSDNELTSLEIPNNVNNIEEGAFSSNHLQSVTIYNSRENIEIGSIAFYDQYNINTNEKYPDIDIIWIDK